MSGKKPPNFSWIVEDVLAGCALPTCAAHFQYLVSQGILHLVTLTEFKPFIHTAPTELKHTFMPVPEFTAPTLEQVKEFVQIVDQTRAQNQGTAVHCHWGRGRTGTMLAAYLIKDERMTAGDAIDDIRRRRPYSIETPDQEHVLYKYADSLNTS